MKKTFIIAGAVILVLMLAGLWIYMMFFGTPRTVEEVLPDFALWGEDGMPVQIPVIAPTTTAPLPMVNVNEKALRQLTTRPVAGYREVLKSASSTPELYYAEVGTGHIYSINLETGAEVRVSGTTIPEAVRADFSSDGRHVVIASGFSQGHTATIGELDASTGALTEVPFTDTLGDFRITEGGDLLYTHPSNTLTGKTFSLSNRTTRTLFTLPFRDATISWGERVTDTHFVYPRPTMELEGFGYAINNGGLTRLPLSGFGFSLFGNESLVGANFLDKNDFVSVFYNRSTRNLISSPVRLLPEKCTFGTKNKTIVWCGASLQATGFGFPDTWYTGEVGFSDDIYEISLTSTSSSLTLITDTLIETGREVDIVDLRVNPTETQLYFINKNDSSLWAYDLSR
ncbi:hypothetical protein K2Q16_01020 [Patescibacteria group bacterium]|nr:hypothetical protein [Patescibacteria group bacterium]